MNRILVSFFVLLLLCAPAHAITTGQRSASMERFIRSAEKIAKRSGLSEAQEVAQYLRANAVASMPVESGLMSIRQDIQPSRHGFRIVPLFSSDYTIHRDLLQAAGRRRGMGQFSARLNVLWFDDAKVATLWEGLTALHEGTHAMQRSRSLNWCQAEYEAFSLQRRILERIGGPKYTAIRQNIVRINIAKHQNGVLTFGGDTDKEWDKAFGRTTTVESSIRLGVLLPIAAIETLEKVLPKGPRVQEDIVHNFCNLYQQISR